MRRLSVSLLLFVSLFAVRAARAEKIAYVDVQRAIQEVEEGKAAKARLRGELEAKRAEIETKRKDLETLKADYDRQAGVLTDEAKQTKMQELQKKYLEVQQLASKMQDELTGKEQEAMRSIGERMLQVVHEVSEKDGFTFVIDKQVLLYAPAASDITNEVVRRYNDKFHGGGNAAAKPKKPKKSAQASPKNEE